jgi:Uma2 family endonuclease
MKAQEALNLVDTLLDSTQVGQRLNDVQSAVFLESWLGLTYREIAQQLSYEHDYIKQIGSQLWRSLSLVVGEEVSKKNIKAVLHRYNKSPNTTQNWSELINFNSVEIDKIKPTKAINQMQAMEGGHWTIQDLEILPANEWTRDEIINGELFVTPYPHRRHQQVCGKISRQLDIWSELSGLGITIISPGLIFSEVNSVIPDVVWVSRERLAQIEDEAGHLTGAPELVIEVLASDIQNERRDKEAKLKLYSVHGVREYWIVNRFTKQVEIYRRENTQLILVATLLGNDEITSPLLPEFGCSIRCFFPE